MSSPFRIFLASSSELAAERAALEVGVYRISKRWQSDGIFLHLEIWEDFIDTVSRTRKQDDYNAAIRNSDLFVILVHHRLGKYSAEEFETAHGAFMQHDKPAILVYLKNPPGPRDADPSEHYQTVRDFLRRLSEIGHFPNRYGDVPELMDHFSQQLHKLRDVGVIKAAVPASRERTPVAQTLHGSGAQAAGERAQAASGRGVNIDGNNTGEVRTGDTHTHTGGGAAFFGPVTNSGTIIGRDHHETHLHAPAPAQDANALAQAIHALRQTIERDASGATQPLAKEMLDELATEAAKPAPQRESGRLARLADGLIDLLPAGAKAVAATLLGPVLAGLAGPLLKAALDKLRGGAVE